MSGARRTMSMRRSSSGTPARRPPQHPAPMRMPSSGPCLPDSPLCWTTSGPCLARPQSIHLLSHADYQDWIDASYVSRFASRPQTQHAALLDERERFKTQVLGLMTRHQGIAAVVVDAERPFADVLNTLLHEMG